MLLGLLPRDTDLYQEKQLVPKIEFLADMDISPLTVEELRKEGWIIKRVPEVMDVRSTDSEILEYAQTHNQVVITQNLDFSALLAIGGYKRPSVLTLRLEDAHPSLITNRLINIIPEVEEELINGAVVSVDETSIRYRRLPILIQEE